MHSDVDALGGRRPIPINLVEVAPAGGVAWHELGRGVAFASFITRDFDIAQAAIAFVPHGPTALQMVASVEALDAVEGAELRLTGCAFDGVGASYTSRVCQHHFALPSSVERCWILLLILSMYTVPDG